MTEEEFGNVVELEADDLTTDPVEIAPAQDAAEEDSPPGPAEGLFPIPCFFHTGANEVVMVEEGLTARGLRRLLDARGRSTFGNTMLINGRTQVPDDEEGVTVRPGDTVVFSGSVKGG